MAGIKVLTFEEWEKEQGMPWLYVQVNSVKYEVIYAFSISVHLVQRVYLERDMENFSPAITWEALNKIGMVGASNLNDIRDSVKVSVDEFINDYLEMNPKE